MVSGCPALRRRAVCGSGAPRRVSSCGMPQRSMDAPAPRPVGAMRIGTAAASPSATNASNVRLRCWPGRMSASAVMLSVMSWRRDGVGDGVGKPVGEALVDLPGEFRAPLDRNLAETEDAVLGPVFHHLEAPEQVNPVDIGDVLHCLEIRHEIDHRSRTPTILHIY